MATTIQNTASGSPVSAADASIGLRPTLRFMAAVMLGPRVPSPGDRALLSRGLVSASPVHPCCEGCAGGARPGPRLTPAGRAAPASLDGILARSASSRADLARLIPSLE